MSDKWKTISLPTSLHDEMRLFLKHHPSFTSKSELTRVAIRQLFEKYLQKELEIKEAEAQEVPASG